MQKRRTHTHEVNPSPLGCAALVPAVLSKLKQGGDKIEFYAERDAKEQLLNKLDRSLLNHAKELVAGDSLNIIGVYYLQGLAEVHCYLKMVHRFDPTEIEALLQFADPLQAAYLCWEDNSRKYSFPICDLLEETAAKECLPLVEPEPPKKLSVKERLNAAIKEARQHLPNEEKTHGGDTR